MKKEIDMPLQNIFRFLSGKNKSAPILGFDPDFYRSRYPDVDSSKMTPTEHYLEIGKAENRDPNAYFNAQGYLEAHPDVAAAGFDALTHFLHHGLAQGYGGWRRHRADNTIGLASSIDTSPADADIAEWVEKFKNYIKKAVTQIEHDSIANPGDEAIKSTLDYYWFHQYRWILTFNKLIKYINQNSTILEVGGTSCVSEFLTEHGIRVSVTTNDLRYEMHGHSDASYDAVLCLEVIEHIKDRDGSEPIDIFNNTGVRCLTSEMFRVLKPGGIVVCTTPNGCSYSSIARAVKMEPPMFLRKHVREFTPSELQDAFEKAGFTMVELYTPPEPWGQRDDLDISGVRDMIVRVGEATDLRHDDIISVFRK